MTINGRKHRELKLGEVQRATDIFSNGHKIESYSVGRRYTKMKLYRTYRVVTKAKES